MPINVGDQAPDFTLKTQDESEWTLSDHRGKNVVLLFYPLDWSPTCEQENCSISRERKLSAGDSIVVGISRDSTWSHKAFRAERGIDHDLLADPLLEVAKQYDLVHPAGFICHRATVIVNKEGVVAFAQVQEKTPEPRDMAEVEAALAKLV